MKRLIVCLLAAGLIAAFSLPAAAVDVQFSGQFKAEGWYETARNLRDDSSVTKAPATGIFDQSLRLDTTFKVSEGLALKTRIYALDKIWGDKTGTADTKDRLNDSSRYARENIEFERAYAEFNIPKGMLRVGYAPTGTLGPLFADNDNTAGMVRWYGYFGPWTFIVSPEKGTEKEVTNPASISYVNQSDVDFNYVQMVAIYKWATGDAGLGYVYYVDKTGRTTADPYQAIYHRFVPYGRMTFGPVYFEFEINYVTGDYRDYESTTTDISRRGYDLYGLLRYNVGPAYVGVQYAYVSGDDPSTADKYEAGISSGREWKPCLILLNSDRDKYLGALGSGGTAVLGNTYSSNGANNFQLYQGFVGFKPIDKLELFASYSYVKLNEKPTGYVDDKVGNEADITATYKIFDNLSYMIGFGYLWAGDAWKGTSAAAQTQNDWLLMHRLTLNF
ncbi:MAG: hypothetical protein ACE14T_01530 [Syntrophales bacterium]